MSMKNSNTTFSSFNPFRFIRANLAASICLALGLSFVFYERFVTSENEASKSQSPEHGTPKKMTEKWTYDEIAKKLIFQYCEQPDDHSTPDGTRVFFQWKPEWPKIKVTI